MGAFHVYREHFLKAAVESDDDDGASLESVMNVVANHTGEGLLDFT